MLGGGLEESLVYQHVVKQLRNIFNFREWKDQDELEYCGASLQKTPIVVDGDSTTPSTSRRSNQLHCIVAEVPRTT